MSWLQFTIAVRTDEAAEFEEALVANGAVAITFESQVDEVVLEPAPGEIPLWERISLVALFPVAASISGLNDALRALDPDIHKRLDVAFIAEEDWQKRMANHAVRAEFGGRLWLLPKRESDRYAGSAEGVAEHIPADKTALFLEPGLAFGSGSHPTTRMCLEWIAGHVLPNQTVLDFGCGSGILGIAAALLGARVIAVDYDDQAVLATRENAEFNQVSDRVETYSLTEFERNQQRWIGHFDVLVANILAAPIIDLAPTFSQALARPGQLVLSGILDHQAQQVVEGYPTINFAPMIAEAEWVCLTGTVA